MSDNRLQQLNAMRIVREPVSQYHLPSSNLANKYNEARQITSELEFLLNEDRLKQQSELDRMKEEIKKLTDEEDEIRREVSLQMMEQKDLEQELYVSNEDLESAKTRYEIQKNISVMNNKVNERHLHFLEMERHMRMQREKIILADLERELNLHRDKVLSYFQSVENEYCIKIKNLQNEITDRDNSLCYYQRLDEGVSGETSNYEEYLCKIKRIEEMNHENQLGVLKQIHSKLVNTLKFVSLKNNTSVNAYDDSERLMQDKIDSLKKEKELFEDNAKVMESENEQLKSNICVVDADVQRLSKDREIFDADIKIIVQRINELNDFGNKKFDDQENGDEELEILEKQLNELKTQTIEMENRLYEMQTQSAERKKELALTKAKLSESIISDIDLLIK